MELQLKEDGSLDEVGIYVASADGGDLTMQEIIDAVSDELIISWENLPLETAEDNFDS